MNLTQVRNATVLLDYGGVRFLIDPMLSPKGSMPPFSSHLRPTACNPLTELPMPVEDLLQVDAVVVTHLHPDHFDQAAIRLLPKSVPLFAQNRQDAEVLRYYGFQRVQVLDCAALFRGVTLTKIPGQYGVWAEEQLPRICAVCGVVFRAEGEPCLYATGDTVWCGSVAEALQTYRPGVVLANAGANRSYQSRLTMGTEDVLAIHKALPTAAIIATHMEDLNNYGLTCRELRRFAGEQGFASRLLTPENGETVTWPAA